jgi:hypothetical protein
MNAVPQSCSLCKTHAGIKDLNDISRRTARENVHGLCISPSHRQTVWEFADLGIAAKPWAANSEKEFKVCVCVWSSLLSLYLKLCAGLIASFLVLGSHCNNVAGVKNLICSIECSCLHHIVNCHCDSAELSEWLSCWNLEQAPVEFCSLCYSKCSSNHRWKLQRFDSRSIRVRMVPVSMWFNATPV